MVNGKKGKSEQKKEKGRKEIKLSPKEKIIKNLM